MVTEVMNVKGMPGGSMGPQENLLIATFATPNPTWEDMVSN
jgi:hypothetical protein